MTHRLAPLLAPLWAVAERLLYSVLCCSLLLGLLVVLLLAVRRRAHHAPA